MDNQARLISALSVFFIMVLWEAISPWRIPTIPRQQRWGVNIALAVFNALLMRFSLGSLAYSCAVLSTEKGWGLLNIWHLPSAFSTILTIVILDFAIYIQHILMHHWPLLWLLHQVHHTDLELDATSALRFHPLEIMLSMLYKIFCILLIGGNPEAVVLFEISLNCSATFNHSNIRIPAKVDNYLRWLIITPDMHRIHHSTELKETNSNYGFLISCWDRLFKTYIAAPHGSQTDMQIGINSIREQGELTFLRCLIMPFNTKN